MEFTMHLRGSNLRLTNRHYWLQYSRTLMEVVYTITIYLFDLPHSDSKLFWIF